MAVVESNVVATELERVLPRVEILFESDDKFFSHIEKKNVEVISNRLMRVPLEMQPGGNFGYFNANGGDLGRGGGPTWDKAELNSVFMKEGIEYTKLVEWSTNSDRKAVQNGVRRLVAGALDELRRQLDAQSMQDGTGVIGTVTSDTPAGGVSVILMDANFGVRLMRAGQTIQVFDVLLTTNRGSGTITSWDVENRTITLDVTIPSVTGGDFIVTSGITTPTAIPALYGVPYQHSNSSTGSWLGIPRSSNPMVRASRVNGNSMGLTLPLPRLAINKIGNRVGIDNKFNPDAWMHPAEAQAYEEIGQLVSIIQKMPKEDSLNMYFGGSMQMAGAPVKCSFNWNNTRIDFVSKQVWGRGEILPIGFYKTDGRNIFEIRGASGGVATAEIFYMVCGFQFFVNNPAACAYIDSLSPPSGYGN